MKKNLKKILACTMALSTLCTVSPVSVSAENTATDENGNSITSPVAERIGEEYIALVPYGKYPYIEAMKSESYFNPTESVIGKEVPEEMLHLIDSEHEGDSYYVDVENTKICSLKYLGDDNNGNMIWSNLNFANLEGFDDENKPIVRPTGYMIEIAKSLGFINNRLSYGSIYDRYICDINGTPKFVGMQCMYNADIPNPDNSGGYSEGYGIYKTFDIVNNEIILVINEDFMVGKKPSEHGIIAQCGDTNGDGTLNIYDFLPVSSDDDRMKKILHYLETMPIPLYIDGEVYGYFQSGDSSLDGTVDIRDVTVINQHIIKANILPEYTKTVADVNNDENIDISDLGLLKQYILRMIYSF